MTTTTATETKGKRRAQRKPALDNSKTIKLRIRKGAQVSATVILREADGGWIGEINAMMVNPFEQWDDKLASQVSQEHCLELCLTKTWSWINTRSLRGMRKAEALEDVETHASQLLGRPFVLCLGDLASGNSAPAVNQNGSATHKKRGSAGKSAPPTDIPETQAEASAKEAAAANGHAHGFDDPGQTRDIDIALIDEHPDNPRVDYGNLAELAKLMQDHGQLQECIGRLQWADKGKGVEQNRVQLLGGHRRYRAAKMAGLKTLRVRIIQCDDARARELLGLDNEARDNFDPIAKGRWYQLMLEHDGLSQRDLAEKLGVSQGVIANHVRLLALPELWRKRLITREITETHARVLAPYADRPRILAEVEKEYGNKYRPMREQPAKEWTRQVRHAIDHMSLPCKKGEYYGINRGKGKSQQYKSGRVLFTPAMIEQHRAELDVVEVADHAGKPELRALNVDRWLELHGNLEAAAEKRKGKKRRTPDAGEVRNAQARKAHQALQRRWKVERELEEYKAEWLQPKIVEALKTCSDRMVLALLIGCLTSLEFNCEQRPLTQILKARGVKPVSRTGSWIDVWATFAIVPAKLDLQALARELLAAWASEKRAGCAASLDDKALISMAPLLGIDFAKQWRVDEDFLDLFEPDELKKLVAEWKLQKAFATVGKKREDQIAAILQADQKKRLPVPKCLAKANR